MEIVQENGGGTFVPPPLRSATVGNLQDTLAGRKERM
jgi:hypothetical protein